VYVSHDLAVVSSLADRVAVMYAGAIGEEGSARDVFSSPAHPYTRGLVASIPDYVSRHPLNGIPGAAPALADRPSGCPFAARCPQVVERCSSDLPALTQIAERRSVRCIRWESTPPLRLEPSGVPDELDGRKSNALLQVDELVVRYGAGAGAVVAARDVSFSIGAGESVALVGESGSGKTTIARSIAGLVTPASGTIRLSDVVLAGHARDRTRKQRQHIQIVFQNPYDSLNPRRTVLDAIARPASLFRGLSGREASGQALELLEAVGVRQGLGERFPRELSGGERQRVAIARALAAQPEILVCDEVTSALDVSVQATVLALLGELRVEFGLTLLFISHDLGVVATVCDRALVLQDGVVRETGSVTQLLEAPQDEYTRLLLESAPRLELAAVGHDGSVG
jgi:peptide/nickel transport system ATP-binding protein